MKLMQRFGDQIDDRYVESYLKWIRDYPGCIDDIWFATYYGYPTIEKHRAYAERLAGYAERFRAAGVTVSMQVSNTHGHGEMAIAYLCFVRKNAETAFFGVLAERRKNMAVYKDGDKWRVIYRYTNYKGERKQTQKRGFATKREAVAWEREVMLKSESKLDMTFASFFEIYEEDKKKRVKENTWESKSHVIRTKILPYFGERKIAEIEPKDVIAWQNELLAYKGENGEVYSPTYLKTIHAQLSAIFNHAIRYYHLPSNPAQKAGSMGSEEHKEMLFWTKEEYLKFADVMMDKPLSYYAFEMLYWCGIRMGELLALTPKDFDFEKQTLTIIYFHQMIFQKGKE